MNREIITTLFAICLTASGWAQADPGQSNLNFPLIVTLQFHSFSLPFRHVKSNFNNIGIGVGTEVSIGGRKNWAQQLSIAWYRNRTIGNGLLFYSQLAYKPTIETQIYSEIKLGAGYLIAARPVESYAIVNGEWRSKGHRGKGLFVLPVGVSLGSNGSSVSPFACYQFMLVHNYNKSIPVVPETLLQIGSRIKINQ